MDDRGLELAYDAGEKQLAAQTASLESIRTRANNILAATALFISFAAAVGVLNTDPAKGKVLPIFAASVLLWSAIIVGVSALLVVWPTKNWVYVTSAEKILARYDAGDDEVAIRKFVISELISGVERNRKKLQDKQDAFRMAVMFVVVEIVALIVGLGFALEGTV